MVLGADLDTIPRSRLYDIADSILAQKISQVDGVGLVNIKADAKPAVRVDLNPLALAHYQIGLAQVRAGFAGGECKFTQRNDRRYGQPMDHLRHRPIVNGRQVFAA